jgi:hypothetical protein
MTRRRRAVAFGALAGACVVGAAASIAAGVGGNEGTQSVAAGARDALVDARAQDRPVILAREVEPGRAGADGQLAVTGSRAGGRTLEPLRCARVYYAAGRGICLARSGGLAGGYDVEIFDDRFRVRGTVSVAGIPSRARVSPDGRYGSVTLFVTGHAYADAGAFSTQTTLLDMRRAAKLADLEQFTVMRGEHRITAVDVNFWGVTFDPSDMDRFYATLATGGRTYLIQGSVSKRTAHVLHENVECPSLSPDGTRIAFKRRTGSAATPWRLTVLDLKTMREMSLAETRSVDDQAEWLDNHHVLYQLGADTWVVPADGGGHPTRLLRGAASPAVVRP